MSRDEGVLEGSRRLDGAFRPTFARGWASSASSPNRRRVGRPGSLHPSRLAQLGRDDVDPADPRASRERMDARLRALRSGNRTWGGMRSKGRGRKEIASLRKMIAFDEVNFQIKNTKARE